MLEILRPMPKPQPKLAPESEIRANLWRLRTDPDDIRRIVAALLRKAK